MSEINDVMWRRLVGALLVVLALSVSTDVWHASRYNGVMLRGLHDSLLELEGTLLDAKAVPIEDRGWILKQSRVHAYRAMNIISELYPKLVGGGGLKGNPIFLFHPDTQYSIATDEELDLKRSEVYDFRHTLFPGNGGIWIRRSVELALQRHAEEAIQLPR